MSYKDSITWLLSGKLITDESRIIPLKTKRDINNAARRFSADLTQQGKQVEIIDPEFITEEVAHDTKHPDIRFHVYKTGETEYGQPETFVELVRSGS